MGSVGRMAWATGMYSGSVGVRGRKSVKRVEGEQKKSREDLGPPGGENQYWFAKDSRPNIAAA